MFKYSSLVNLGAVDRCHYIETHVQLAEYVNWYSVSWLCLCAYTNCVQVQISISSLDKSPVIWVNILDTKSSVEQNILYNLVANCLLEHFFVFIFNAWRTFL